MLLKMAGAVDGGGRQIITVLSSPAEPMPDPKSKGEQFDGYKLRIDVSRKGDRGQPGVPGEGHGAHPKSIDVTLAESPALSAGAPASFPFRVQVPANAFASLTTPSFETSRTLAGRVNRRFRKAEKVEVPFEVLTALPTG